MGIVSMNGVSSAFFGKVEQFLQIHIISMEVPFYCWLSIGVGIYDQTLQNTTARKKIISDSMCLGMDINSTCSFS